MSKEDVSPQATADILAKIGDVLLDVSRQRCADAVERVLQSAARSMKHSWGGGAVELTILRDLGLSDEEKSAILESAPSRQDCGCPDVEGYNYEVDEDGRWVCGSTYIGTECEFIEPYKSDATGGVMIKPFDSGTVTQSETGRRHDE